MEKLTPPPVSRVPVSYTHLGFLGIEIEEKNNAANEGVISAAASRVAVRVIRTNEEHVIAKAVCSVLGLGSKKGELNYEHRNSYAN